MISIFTSAIGLATSYLDGKAKVRSAEAETKMKIATGEISWEQSAIEASNNSYKDELWTVVFVIILAANFIPSLQDTMASGFANLQNSTTLVTFKL